VKDWPEFARASRSPDPTSLALSHRSVIAQTRERNCWTVSRTKRLECESIGLGKRPARLDGEVPRGQNLNRTPLSF